MIDIEKLASEAGMNTSMWKYGAGSMVFTLGIEGVARGAIERFAAPVRNEVLEEAAKVCDEEAPSLDGQLCAEAIRSRIQDETE